jgi:hypothetical protein
VVLRLAGLEPQALAEMAQATGRGVLSTTELARLHQITGGNPLLMLSLLETEEPFTAVSQPQILRLQRQRLATLDDAALLVLQAAATLGYRFDYALWESVVMGIHTADLPVLAGELERGRFLVLEADGYRVPHDTLRACVYQGIPPQRRQYLHQRALLACAEHQPANTQALLHHATQAEAKQKRPLPITRFRPGRRLYSVLLIRQPFNTLARHWLRYHQKLMLTDTPL